MHGEKKEGRKIGGDKRGKRNSKGDLVNKKVHTMVP